MANLTQQQVQTALAGIFEALTDSAPVLTDYKFSQNERDLHDLLAGEVDGRAKGWVLSWKEVVGFEVDGNGCTVNTTLRYRVQLFYPYLNESPGGRTSQGLFEDLVDAGVEGLSANRIPKALDGHAEILSFTTRREFTVIDWTGSTKPDASHFGEFDLDVKIDRTY